MDERVPTKGSALKKDVDFQVAVFSKRQNNKPKQPLDRKTINSCNTEFDIRKATKEIIKMGATGFYKRKRDKTLRSLAIELGAKPEKRRFHNYKDLKKIRSKHKERKEQRLQFLQASSNLSAVNQYRKKYARKAEKKKEVDIMHNYGKRNSK